MNEASYAKWLLAPNIDDIAAEGYIKSYSFTNSGSPEIVIECMELNMKRATGLLTPGMLPKVMIIVVDEEI
jgi:hypothetical protein